MDLNIFYLTYKKGFYALEEEDLSKFYLPALNMTHEELKARPDIIFHIKDYGFDPDQLPSFNDLDIDHWTTSGNFNFINFEVHLVDHN